MYIRTLPLIFHAYIRSTYSARTPGIRAFAVDAFRCIAAELLLLERENEEGDEEMTMKVKNNDDEEQEKEKEKGEEILALSPQPSSTITAAATAAAGGSGGGAVMLSVGWLLPSGLDAVLFEDLLAAPPAPKPNGNSSGSGGNSGGSSSSSGGADSGNKNGVQMGVPLLTARLLEPLQVIAEQADRQKQTDVLEQVCN